LYDEDATGDTSFGLGKHDYGEKLRDMLSKITFIPIFSPPETVNPCVNWTPIARDNTTITFAIEINR